MTNKELLQRNYASTVGRGLISKDTHFYDFIEKIEEETNELEKEIYYHKLSENAKLELADIILVCLNFATHYDIDIFKYLEQKIEINENRVN